MRRRVRRSETSDIDISPLIDMVFILLIFFMVSTTFVKDMSIDLQRPGAQSATKASTKALRIVIDEQQAVFIDGNPVRPWMIQSRVRDFLEMSDDKQVLVVTDRRVSAEKLVEVVDQCRMAGALDVGVATEKEAG
ncbi:MAG: ExbD/TolR family protein [Bradymonadia bacterium]